MTTEPAPFADFLAAKFALDSRSIDPHVRAAFVGWQQRLHVLRCLDLGAGTGATLRRVLEWRGERPWSLTLVERDPAMLALAQAQALQALAQHGAAVRVQDGTIRSCDGGRVLHFEPCALEAYAPAARFDAVIAHAFLDLVALEPALARIRRWLHRGGCLYAAINYDGETAFDPRPADPGFEAELLAAYNESMEARRVDGSRTGGAYCGRRLHALLPQHGFEIVREGPSDWNIVPQAGRYRDRDESCLASLLALVGEEAARTGRFEAHRLQRWREERTRLLRAGRLALRVRNRDVLARVPGGEAPAAQATAAQATAAQATAAQATAYAGIGSEVDAPTFSALT